MKAFRFTDHALGELHRRGIGADVAQAVLDRPEQIVEAQHGRKVYQSRIADGTGKLYLIRLVIDAAERPEVVVTAYRTSKVEKYWRL